MDIGAARYLDHLSFGAYDVSPDGRRIAFVANITGAPELWLADTARMWPRRLTFSGETVSDVTFDPQGQEIWYISDRGGDEVFSIFRLRLGGGVPELVLGGDGARYFAPMVAGHRLLYCTDGRDPRAVAPVVRDSRTGAELSVGEPGVSTVIADHSPDGSELLLVAVDDSSSQRLIYCNLDRGERRQIVGDGDHSCLGGVFSSDRSRVLFAATLEGDCHQLFAYDLATGEICRQLAFDGDIATYELSADRRLLAAAVDNGLESRLEVHDLEAGTRLSLPSPGTDFAQFAFRGQSLFMLAGDPTLPLCIHRLNLVSGQVERLTDSLVGGLEPELMVVPEPVSYRSFDGRVIHGLLYRTQRSEPGRVAPVIVWIHSGPHLVERLNYRGTFQYLAAMGYTVFCPNFRGSVGFGREFQTLAHRDWGGGPRRDVLAGIEWLLDQGLAVRERIALAGGSFGGYMALLIAGLHPDLPRAVVDFFGPSDLRSFVLTAPEYWRSMVRATIGDPERDAELLREQSPMTYIDRVKCPVMIVQGERDTRVVRAESDRVASRLGERGVPVEYVLLPDEGHGFTNTSNLVSVMERMANFLDRWLGTDAGV